METLELNDGTILNGHVIEDDTAARIFVYLDGKTIADGFDLFRSPDRSSRITAMNHGEEHVYEGYTQILSVSGEFGNCNLVMRRESDA